MAYTGDGLRVARTRSRGESPLARSISSSLDAYTASPEAGRRVRSESTTPRNASSASQRSQRFAFLDAFRPSPAALSLHSDEELLTMDIDQALLPYTSLANQDPFSPAAFKSLQVNAAGMLRKYQTAYLYKTQQVQQLKEQYSVQADRKEDAEENIQNLKNQLERMAQKASEQESIMQALMGELNREKRLRVSLEHDSHETPKAHLHVHSHPSALSEAASEDLFAERDQNTRYRSRRRRSAATMKSDTTEFDTDEESIEETSVFSRSRSPTISTTLSEISMETCARPSLPPPVPPKSSAPPRSTPKIIHTSPTVTESPQLNPLQRLWKGMSSSDASSEGKSPNGCRNCQGQATSVAWDTVSLLRDENRELKQRVGDLEEAVEGALDAVMGLKLKP